MKRSFILSVVCLLAQAFIIAYGQNPSVEAGEQSLKGRRPNVLILYADDLGYGDPGCYNPDSKIPTPHLDQLAAEGMRFTDGHSSSGICTPSRYALLTGRYHWRDFHGIVNAFGKSVFKPERFTLPEMLQEAGYHTAAIGKWHLGWNWDAIRKPDAALSKRGKGAVWGPEAFDWSKPIPDGPLAHGFDYYFGDTVINFPPYGWIENDRLIKAPDTLMNPKKWKPIKEGNWECRGGPMCSDWDPYQNIPVTTQKGVDYIHEQAEIDQPFLLYFAFPSPHAPIIPNDEFDGKSGAGPYGDFVAETDDACGRLLAALEESGQADNTIVIMTADNGPAHYAYPRDQKFDHWSAEPLRGLKADIYEGGHRVPFIIRWTGVIQPGSVSDALVSQIDIMATLAEVLDVKLPDTNAAEDSFSFLPVLRGEREQVRDHLVHNTFPQSWALRDGDWTLVMGKDGYHSARRPAWEKKRNYPADNDSPVELYHITSDLGQRSNAAEEHPDRVAAMQQKLEQVRKRGHSAPHLTKQDSAQAEKSLEGSRPNIILVMTDDQGMGDLSCMGNPILKTPNLDRFYENATRFTDFHVSPTCAPTRGALMSGRPPFDVGITHTILQRERMALDVVTFPEALQKAGYKTGLFGKWHLGDEEAYLPQSRGFDEVLMHGAGGIGQYAFGDFKANTENTYFDNTLLHNDTIVKTKGFCTDIFFHAGLAWIKEKLPASSFALAPLLATADKSRTPFFAYISLNAPHGPMIAPEKYTKRFLDEGYDQKTAGRYGMIENIDDNMGLLMEKLHEWKALENTLVIFMTDNGMSMGPIKVEGQEKTIPPHNAGMRGGKNSPWEGGTHVPAFWYWKGVLGAGVDVPALTAHLDLYRTFCDLAGAEIPESKLPPGGRSLLPLLENPNAEWADRKLFVHKGRWSPGKREAHKSLGAGVRTERWRLVFDKRKDGVLGHLSDIDADPGERKNVAGQQPQVVKELTAAYDVWWDSSEPLLVNEGLPRVAPENHPLTVRYEKQLKETGITDWEPASISTASTE